MAILAFTSPAYLWFLAREKWNMPVWKTGRAATTILAATLASALLAAGGLALNLQSGNTELDTWMHGRLGIWKDTLKMIAANPWFGHGPGSFQRVFPEYRSTELGIGFGFYEPIFDSHNVGLQILAETGLIGLAIFAAFLLHASGITSLSKESLLRNRDAAFFSGISLGSCGLFSLTGEISHVLFCTLFSWMALSIFHNAVTMPRETVSLGRAWAPVPIAITILLIAIAGFAYFGSRLAANIRVKKGTDAIAAGSDRNSIRKHLHAALRLQPRNAYALYQLGYLSMGERKFGEALGFYRSVRAIDPHFENVRFNMGVARYSQGDFRGAIVDFSETARLYPTFGNASFFLAKSFQAAGEYDSALVWCDRMIARGSFVPHATALRDSVAQLRSRDPDRK